MEISRKTDNPISANIEPEEDRTKLVSVRRLMWLRFRRNRLAVIGGIFLVMMYLAAIFAGFVAPNDPTAVYSQYVSMQPQSLNFVDEEGNFHPIPFVYGVRSAVDKATFRRTFEIVPEEK